MPLKRQLVEVRSSVEAKAYDARGVTRWAIDTSFVTDDGRPVRLQRRGFQTRGDAIRWAETEITLLKIGAKELPTRRAARRKEAADVGLTTRQVLERMMTWWFDSGRKRPSTLSIDRHALGKHVLPVLGDVPWKSLTQAHMDDLVRGAVNMQNPRHLIVLRSALRDCGRLGLPTPQVRIDFTMKPRNQREDYFTPDELDCLCDHASPEMALVFRLLWYTGLRIGEFQGLEWGDISFRKGAETLTVRRTVYRVPNLGFSVQAPKNGKHRTIPLNQAAIAALQGLRELHDSLVEDVPPSNTALCARLVYPAKDGGYVCKEKFFNALGRACERARLRHISPHVLRHSFASNLVQAGVDLHTLSVLLGHSSVAMTQRYAHLAKEGLRAATNVLDRLTRQGQDPPAGTATATSG